MAGRRGEVEVDVIDHAIGRIRLSKANRRVRVDERVVALEAQDHVAVSSEEATEVVVGDDTIVAPGVGSFIQAIIGHRIITQHRDGIGLGRPGNDGQNDRAAVG